jgi:hypothetical protein
VDDTGQEQTCWLTVSVLVGVGAAACRVNVHPVVFFVVDAQWRPQVDGQVLRCRDP